MFIVHVKTRGKVLKIPSGEMVRTPRKIKVKNEDQLETLLGSMRAQCIYDYEIIENKNGVMDKKEISKRLKYSTADNSIKLGGKITGRHGG